MHFYSVFFFKQKTKVVSKLIEIISFMYFVFNNVVIKRRYNFVILKGIIVRNTCYLLGLHILGFTHPISIFS